MEKTRVFLSDPQVLFREGIHFILSGEEDFEVIGETTGNAEAFTMIAANPPDIAILGMTDIQINGPEICRRVKRSLPSVSVILTTQKKEEEQLFSAIRSGASACITKDTSPEVLLDIIRVVAEGESPIVEELLAPSLAGMVLSEFEDMAALSEQLENLLAGLSPREGQVLSAIAAGSGAEEAAARLNISEEAVMHDLGQVLNKLVANDRARSIIEAAQRSLPAMMRVPGKKGGKGADFVTKEEFNEFKDNLMERLKSFIGELN
jgi:DNA-binding NarL/FixJ family response regulator